MASVKPQGSFQIKGNPHCAIACLIACVSLTFTNDRLTHTLDTCNRQCGQQSTLSALISIFGIHGLTQCMKTFKHTTWWKNDGWNNLGNGDARIGA